MKYYIYEFLRLIPSGKVVSYNFLAQLFCIHPRTVAKILSQNTDQDIYPCYKVVNSDGKIGGYNLGVTEKIKKLENDGILIDSGKIDKNYFRNPRLYNYFIAFPLDDNQIRSFQNLSNEIKNILGSKDFKYQKLTTPHITLRFLGDISADLLKNLLKDTLNYISTKNIEIKNQTLEINNFNNFDDRVYFMEPSKNQIDLLINFYRNYIKSISYLEEERPFYPHMTLFIKKKLETECNLEIIRNLTEKYCFYMSLTKVRFYCSVGDENQVPLFDIDF